MFVSVAVVSGGSSSDDGGVDINSETKSSDGRVVDSLVVAAAGKEVG